MKNAQEEIIMSIHQLTQAIEELSWAAIAETKPQLENRIQTAMVKILNASEDLSRAKRILNQ